MSNISNFRHIKPLGKSRELLWDEAPIAEMQGVSLVLHHPVPRNVAIVHDAPWEGNVCCYHTVLKYNGQYRMYYRGATYKMATDHEQVTCVAVSDDGINWTKPDLGIFEFNGSKHNNIVWMGDVAAHNFTPFVDDNPECLDDCRFKAVGGDYKTGLMLYTSTDGFHWKRALGKGIITDGLFDSQNTIFFDKAKNCYISYNRKMQPLLNSFTLRAIQRCVSTDMLHWSRPEWLSFNDGVQDMELYTNAITPYCRCPEMYVGFPKRFTRNRKTVYDMYAGDGLPGVSDGVFMSSRDGLNFNRWPEAFIRPGLQHERWINRNNMVAWGLVETASDMEGTPNEISLYSTEAYYSDKPNRLRRMTVRLDGFASAQAPFKGGSFTTKYMTFDADGNCTNLLLNASTSGAGGISCEIIGEDGNPVPGFSMDDAVTIYADDIEIPMEWKNGNDLSALAGKPIALRFNMSDADIYSFRFGSGSKDLRK